MNQEFAVAVKCVICFDEKILLLKKSEHEKIDDASHNVYDLPGGRIMYQENVEDAVNREVFEETSLTLKESMLKSASTVMRPDGVHLIILLFKGICHHNNVILSDEHSSYHWMGIDEINSDLEIPKWIKESCSHANAPLSW